MRALRERVHAGVSATGPVNGNVPAGNSMKSTFELVLNGVAMGLALPAGVFRTVVRDEKLKPLRHRLNRRTDLPRVEHSRGRDILVRSFGRLPDRLLRVFAGFFFQPPRARDLRRRSLTVHPTFRPDREFSAEGRPRNPRLSARIRRSARSCDAEYRR